MKTYTEIIEVVFSRDYSEKTVHIRQDVLESLSKRMDSAVELTTSFPHEYKKMFLSDSIIDTSGRAKMIRVITFINPVWKI